MNRCGYGRCFLPVWVAVLLPMLITNVAHSGSLESIEKEQQALFDRVSPSVVFIASGRSFGSGFFVSSDGLILTNSHVVQKAKQVDVILQNGKKVVGTVIEKAKDNIDLALIKTKLNHTPVLKLGGMGQFRVGSFVASVGHGRGGIWTFSTGMVSNIYPSGSKRPVFQTQIPLNPGSSGGPIFDRNGVVVGVVTAGLVDSNNINFGIKSDVAIQSFKQLQAAADMMTISAPKGVPVFLDDQMVGTGPVVTVYTSAGTHTVSAVVNGVLIKRTFVYPKKKSVSLGLHNK